MALITEDGTGRADAESFTTVVEADAYHVSFSNTAWAAATTAAKEVALRKATRYVEAMFRYRWNGRRTTMNQSLSWPRVSIVDADGFSVLPNIVPPKVKQATSEMALRALTEDLIPDQSAPGSIASESVSVGPISKSTSYVGGKSQTKAYVLVRRILQEFIGQSDTMERA
jgi:hypothetical protein